MHWKHRIDTLSLWVGADLPEKSPSFANASLSVLGKDPGFYRQSPWGEFLPDKHTQKNHPWLKRPSQCQTWNRTTGEEAPPYFYQVSLNFSLSVKGILEGWLPGLLSSSKRSWGASSAFSVNSLKLRLIRPLLSEENPPSLLLIDSNPSYPCMALKHGNFPISLGMSWPVASHPLLLPSPLLMSPSASPLPNPQVLNWKKLQPNTVPYRKAAFHVGIKYQLHEKPCSALITLMKNHPINQVSNQLISHKKVETVILSINS